MYEKIDAFLKRGIFARDCRAAVVLDQVCAVLLALCPLLQHYVGPVYNAALTVIVLLLPYLGLRTLPRLWKMKWSTLGLGLATMVYFIYRTVDHGTNMTEFGQSGVFVLYVVIMVLGVIDTRTLIKTATCVALVASLCMMIQYVSFYFFDHHIQMVPTDLFLPMAEQWKLGAQTGLAGVTGRMNDFYRPSAFFLEPSHFFLYAFPHLVLVLFRQKHNWQTVGAAVLLSVGMVLCTSGMGIAAAAGTWGLFFLLQGKDGSFHIKHVLRVRNMVLMLALIAVLIVMYMYVPFVRRTISRIFATKTGVTAITGRVSKAGELVMGMTPMQWVFGVEDTTHAISYNMPGFLSSLYRHGLIGLVLVYEFYTKSLFKLKLPYVIVAAIIIVVSLFSAHTHSTVGMLYYFLILMCGYMTAARKGKQVPAEQVQQ